jgi:hypothetical protein
MRPTALLERAYEDLDLVGGKLLDATDRPPPGGNPDDWRRLGDWLMLARRVGAERVFFVGDDPVLVFSALPSHATERDVVRAYRRTWCLARPRCLFLAKGNELRVYALTAPPPAVSEDGEVELKPLAIVERAGDVAQALQLFQRDQLEAGVAFESPKLASRKGRADERLISDVRAATGALADAGLARTTAHALIERVILVRYLEDRQIIVPSYIEEVAQRRPEWEATLAAPLTTPNYGAESTFARCLADKSLTYAVFARLAEDFNGDLFVDLPAERTAVEPEHLSLIEGFLRGTASARQEPLFLWAYDFSIVPTSLISKMYEIFHQEDIGGKDSHYTPTELVEYVLARTLTDEVLARRPRICDPACGSGLFLVEAYRYLVRYEMARTGRSLTPARLRKLLLEQIAGIDINEEAIRLAAFSLYLAYLDYQSPQNARKAGRLPRLIQHEDHARACPLVVADAFAECCEGRDADVGGSNATLPWAEKSFDVIVGNPPWTKPQRGASRLPDTWAKQRALAVGDRSRSQLFLWRALSLLKDRGTGALLVAATTFLTMRSKDFRGSWLQQAHVEQVVNFTNGRHVFFTGSVAPFMLVRFNASSEPPPLGHRFVYETVVRSEALQQTKSMGVGRLERRVVTQSSLQAHDYLWKAYAWGGHYDAALLSRLDLEPQLGDLLPRDPGPGWGYQWGNKKPSSLLRELRSLQTVEPCGPIRPEWLEPAPTGVKHQPDERRYDGPRLLVSSFVKAGFGPYVRLEQEPLSFRHTIYCIPLNGVESWEAKVMLGTLLSSLGRYRLFMLTAGWGVWKDKLNADDLQRIPVRLIAKHPATDRLIEAVDALRAAEPPEDNELDGLWGQRPAPRHTAPATLWEEQTTVAGQTPSATKALEGINDAVAELFELSPAERDLVSDFGLRLEQSRHRKPPPPAPLPRRRLGRAKNLSRNDPSPFWRYLATFLTQWNDELKPHDGELNWRLQGDERLSVVAAIFETQARGATAPKEAGASMEGWRNALDRLGSGLLDAEELRHRLYRDCMLRAVSDTAIVIVKRNEQRLWTATAAREDAEATLMQAMALPNV